MNEYREAHLSNIQSCWICGAPADSGEHIVKASDLRNVFGEVSQKSPLFMKTASSSIKRVGSLKSNSLKFSRRICCHCNTTRTQPYDLAWASMANYLNHNRKISQIPLCRVFREAAAQSSVAMHLFFVKLFGCRMAEEQISVPLSEMAEALTHFRPHPHVYIKLFREIGAPDRRYAYVSPISAHFGNASFGYHVGGIGVHLRYDPLYANDRIECGYWNPVANLDDRISVHRF